MRIRSKLFMAAGLAATLVLTACAGSDQPAAVDTATEEETTDDTVGEDGKDQAADLAVRGERRDRVRLL